MRVLKTIFGFFVSRLFWSLVGLALLSAAIWFWGPLVSVGTATPLAGELTRLIVIGAILIAWLFWQLVRQLRAARANQVFVTELAQPPEPEPAAPGAENVAEVHEKFAGVLDQMQRSKLGRRRFLREMPWYVIIGPPGTGKTTALRQSGLHFPIDLSDDLQGVGGTRNCDWFFTEDAVLIDTAGRYTEQGSDTETDAAEWQGFLDLLQRHRGRRALNGVIVTLSVEGLAEDEARIRAHGREIRRRLAELQDKLKVRLPVYLMVTKADLIPGFEAFFDDLSTREREQVWGATFGTETRVDGVAVGREVRALLARLEERLPQRLAGDDPLPRRAETFRFPAQVERLTAPLKVLIETVFGESRYEAAPWLRGFYFTSATQEGSPIDRLVGGMAAGFGLAPEPPARRRHGEKRSFFLHDTLARLIFPEAGLATLDPRAEERRVWIWRGTLAGSALAAMVAALFFVLAFLRYSGAIAEQERQFTLLASRLANVAARQAPTDPLDLDLALEATNAVAAAEPEAGAGPLAWTGPTAEAELDRAHQIAFRRTLRNVLEPRMVALLEATMWRQIRDPDYLLGALKVYQMMTGLAPYDAEFVAAWWQELLPEQAPVAPFPNATARLHQLAAIERMAGEEDKIEADPALVAAALESVCQIPLAVRAYEALLADPSVAGLDDWVPAEVAGPNGPQVLTRLSGETLRVGLPGAFTFAGFHQTVLPLVPEIAAEAVLDRAVFAGGCDESAEASVATLEEDMLKLYYEDYVAKWDSILRDVRLAPIDDLATAQANLKDLSSEDSALMRLLNSVVAETNLTRSEEEGGGAPAGTGKVLSKAASKLGKIGKLAKKGSRLVSTGDSGPQAPQPGTPVAEHFLQIRATVQPVDGQPPLLTDVVTALTALSNELQVIAASPKPEEALAQRGGLAELTGAVVNLSATLPDPIDDWLGAIATDTRDVTQEIVRQQLNARWRADVLPFCVAATAGRYPFDASSAIDVNIPDFGRLFGPGGLIDSFIEEHLRPYIDTGVRPWTWRADFGLPAEALKPFERARAIRDALFPGGGSVPVMAFTLEPRDLSPAAQRVSLNVDGQVLAYFNAGTRPMPMTWPGPDGTNMVTLSFVPVDGSGDVITSEIGAWAFLRLVRGGRLSPTELPELFRLTLAAGGHSAEFDLRAASVENPFDLQMFGAFTCPRQI